jgi:hypothetical protein
MSFAVLFSLQGCSSHSYYADSEKTLNTAGYYDLLDHIAAYYPRGIALNFPGYVVGFEEAPRRLVADDISDIRLDKSVYEAGYTVRRLVKSLRYRTPFVSQIMRYEGRPYGQGNCSLYNLYNNHGSTFVSPCNGSPDDALAHDYNYQSAFDRSWYAIDLLKSRLQRDVVENHYSHIIVAVMGLDTAQEEAIRNYKSIISSIRMNAGNKFNPLFIGITWPSFYANRWFDPVWEVLSYHPVADRADVLGLSWLGVLLNDVIMPLNEKAEVTIIGHSFGTRAATMALCVGPGILSKSGKSIRRNPRGKIENFIGLAPAFSLSRFIDEDYRFYENVYYRDYCPTIKRFIFTASSQDAAFAPVFWSDAVGDHDFMLDYCKNWQPVSVSCISADAQGKIKDYNPAFKVTYIDTSALMKYTMPGTEGGGHSDIYRTEVGHLLWTVLNGDKH